MNGTTKLRLATSGAFAALVVIAAWVITAALGFSSDGLTATIAVTLAIGAGIWAFVVNSIEAEAPKQYALKTLQSRPLLLSFGLFVALLILWGIGRAIIEWAIEPDMYDYGACSRFFRHYPCGDVDLNSDRRYLATELVDKIAAGMFLIAPMSLAVRKVRAIFQ